MNLTTVALAALALLAFRDNGKSAPQRNADSLKSILSEDTNRLLDTIGTLNDKNASKEDKTGALLQVVTNPAVLNLAGSLFQGGIFGGQQSGNNDSFFKSDNVTENYDGKNGDKTVEQQSYSQPSDNANINEEGYDLGQYSDEARNFFRPVENIAGIEASHKLYKLYDDWYSKKH